MTRLTAARVGLTAVLAVSGSAAPVAAGAVVSDAPGAASGTTATAAATAAECRPACAVTWTTGWSTGCPAPVARGWADRGAGWSPGVWRRRCG
jgi:hypothetical protein